MASYWRPQGRETLDWKFALSAVTFWRKARLEALAPPRLLSVMSLIQGGAASFAL
eukprot:CAMPEP_0173439668 /NCGR_PEP_ID=MMETSP1357-20121228/21369_1 /TAXON_ID=77926 /ORGANISM="Hemiselmis rufescens, Strain PCC563" /LENGTH=54 /DNA_ID=CAMNT_0014405059 /DNA_START=337 /DNA_END=501 /DNA_ORIENTATION=+